MSHEQDTSLPLTTGQLALWAGQKMSADDVTLNIAEMLEICGPVQVDAFLRALHQVTREAETLRVGIVDKDGRPRQWVRPEYHGKFPVLDVSGDADPRAVAEAWMRAELSRPVDLANDPLWVSALFKAADDRYYWYQRAHHLIYDGYSGGMVARRVAELYSAYVEGREPAPCEFGPLRALIEAEAAYRQSDRFHRDREFWKAQLSGLPPAVSLARSGPRDSMGSLLRSTGHLPSAVVGRLIALGKQTATSLPQVLIALIAAYYHRVSGANDLAIVMPVSGRVNAVLRRSPGLAANIVTIRLTFTSETTAVDLFAQVAQVVRQALRHQQYRYEDLRRELGLTGMEQHIAWLGVNIEPFDYQLSFSGASAIAHNISNGSGKDLVVFVYDRGDGRELRFDFDANPMLYSVAELDEHRRRLVRLIDEVLAEPTLPLRYMDILGEEERQRLSHNWNDTAIPIRDESLPAQIARQAMLNPSAPAVIFEDVTLTYEELHRRSVLQARQLIADGILPGDIVGVMLPRGEQLLVVMLAIMRAGATYLLLDAEDPPKRIATILEDASPIALVATQDLCERFALGGMLSLNPENLDVTLDMTSTAPDHSSPSGTACLIYTSGPTGRPKGVEIMHRNLIHLLQAMGQKLALRRSDYFLATAAVTLDIVMLELLLPLTQGACVEIAANEAVRHPSALRRLIRRATHMCATPSLWRELLADARADLKHLHVLVSGEVLSAELAGQLTRCAASVSSLYGYAETTVCSAYFQLDKGGVGTPPIGRPFPNTRFYVLDKHRQLVPTGAVGELYIAGAGVAKGYIHHHQATESRFLPDPFSDDGSSMYRTGDSVRWDDEGVLHFVRYADHWINIRGHRFELGEIERRLVQHASIAEAAVTAQADEQGEVALKGYVVVRTGRNITVAALSEYLADYLPEYMIPAHLTVLDVMPLMPDGRLDRKALAVIDRSSRARYVEPVTSVEKKLAALWQRVLGVERVGLHDNFFDLGGDSLTAVEMIAHFPKHFGRELPLGSLFEVLTVANLAAVLQSAEGQHDPFGVVLPLRSLRSEKRPLFCFHPGIGISWAYSGLLQHLDEKFPVYGLQSRGLSIKEPMPGSIQEMAADYLVQIKSIQPNGPYRLLGWSLGGLVAHEVAAQLKDGGQSVEFLALLDAYPSNMESSLGRMEPAQEIEAILRFLGFHHLAGEDIPADMAALTSLLCKEYGIFSMPLIQEITRTDPQLIQRVSMVARNNLSLVRKHVPQRIEVDTMFFQAMVKNNANLVDLWQDSPSAWQPYIGGRFEVYEVACDHHAMLDAPAASQIGRLVMQRLRALPSARARALPDEADDAFSGSVAYA